MALFENFPYTDMHQLNLDWLIDQLNKISESNVLSVNGQTGNVILYQDHETVLPNVPEDNWTLLRMCDGSYRGILFGNDDRAYIIHGSLMAQIYSQNNQPPYPVTKVNGKTGEVELYTEQYVRLPDLTDAQMANWTFFRMLNGVSHGIQFNDDGTASIINGTSRFNLYTSNNPPDYPVDSVNGRTGDIILFTDANGAISFPTITDPDTAAWSLERNLNGTVYGLILDEDGYLHLKVGANVFTVYTSNNPAGTYVEDTTDSIQQVTDASEDDFWGLMRETSVGSVGIMFENSDQNNPTAYIAYVDSNDQQQTIQILTPNDIPGSSVVSVNGQTGVVVLRGTNIAVSATDPRMISDAITDVKEVIAYVEDDPDDEAVNSYVTGQYLIWHDNLFKANTSITAGDTLTNVILDPVTNIADLIVTCNDNINALQNNKVDRYGPNTYYMDYAVFCTGVTTNGSHNLNFIYPLLAKAGVTIGNITISDLTVRGTSGYILEHANMTDLAGWSLSGTRTSWGIQIYMQSPTALSVTNNTPIVVQARGTFRIS